MTRTELIGALVLGLLIGVLGRPAIPGTQGLPIWLTIVMGVGASLLGALIADRLNKADTNGCD